MTMVESSDMIQVALDELSDTTQQSLQQQTRSIVSAIDRAVKEHQQALVSAKNDSNDNTAALSEAVIHLQCQLVQLQCRVMDLQLEKEQQLPQASSPRLIEAQTPPASSDAMVVPPPSHMVPSSSSSSSHVVPSSPSQVLPSSQSTDTLPFAWGIANVDNVTPFYYYLGGSILSSRDLAYEALLHFRFQQPFSLPYDAEFAGFRYPSSNGRIKHDERQSRVNKQKFKDVFCRQLFFLTNRNVVFQPDKRDGLDYLHLE